MNRLMANNVTKAKESAHLHRLPRECGGPVDDKLLVEVNSSIDYVIGLFEELLVYWIPAFARKTLGFNAFLKSRNLSEPHHE
jgi:hypothetical protein